MNEFVKECIGLAEKSEQMLLNKPPVFSVIRQILANQVFILTFIGGYLISKEKGQNGYK